MNYKNLLTSIVVCIFLFPFFSLAQIGPGGVTHDLGLWVKSDDAGNISTAWKDQSPFNKAVPAVGAWALSPADAAHNFHPYTTGYTSSKYFRDDNSKVNYVPGWAPDARSNSGIFSAARPNSASGSGRITGIDNDLNFAAEPGLSLNNGKLYAYKYMDNVVTSTSTKAVTANQTGVFSMVQDKTVAPTGTRRLGMDGTYQSYSVSSTDYFYLIGPYLNIGYGSWDLAAPFPGDIMEVIWFRKELTTTEQSRVNSYLAIKHGVTSAENYLNSAGTVVWDLATNTTFNKNIAGVGRDDNSALNQKQSNSINVHPMGQLVVSLGNRAASNAANTNTFSADKQLFLWGDNGLANLAGQNLNNSTAYTALNYSSASSTDRRYNRIWLGQNSGVAQPLRFAYPQNFFGVTPSGCQKLVMLISTDATFTDPGKITGYSLLQSNATTSTYDAVTTVPAGNFYFTVALLSTAPNGVADLPLSNKIVPVMDPCPIQGYTYYYESADAARDKKLFAINWNGNTPPANVTGTLRYNASPFSVSADGKTCNIMGRMLEINPPGGSFTINGGVKVRMYYSDAEKNATLPSGVVSQSWFKSGWTIDDVIASNNGKTINGDPMTPVLGIEDGVKYAEFTGVTSFSTFGFVASTHSVALPVSFGAINPKLVDGNLVVDWQTLMENNNKDFDIELSTDGTQFKLVGTVPSKAVDGISTETLAYHFTKPLGEMALGITLGVALLALVGFKNRKYRILIGALLVAVFALVYGCHRSDVGFKNKDGKLFVRIVQNNKDGTKKYSKIFEAVRQ